MAVMLLMALSTTTPPLQPTQEDIIAAANLGIQSVKDALMVLAPEVILGTDQNAYRSLLPATQFIQALREETIIIIPPI